MTPGQAVFTVEFREREKEILFKGAESRGGGGRGGSQPSEATQIEPEQCSVTEATSGRNLKKGTFFKTIKTTRKVEMEEDSKDQKALEL